VPYSTDNRSNNALPAHEFDIIVSEFQQYDFLKEQVRAKLTRQPSSVNVEKLEKDIRGKSSGEERGLFSRTAAGNRA